MRAEKRRNAGHLRHCQATARQAAAKSVMAVIRAGSAAYDRGRDLPGLVRVEASRAVAETPEEIAAIVARLERALRAERHRARSGHWTYDLNRHIALRQAWQAESERLAGLQRSGHAPAPPAVILGQAQRDPRTQGPQNN